MNSIHIKFSVIICSHNPKIEYLERVLSALQKQTMDTHKWELLIIDNNSKEPIRNLVNISWQPNVKIFEELETGLTRARIRGINESKGEWLIFVDDDNVLNHDFLEVASNISNHYLNLGAFGGSAIGEFEEQPDISVLHYLDIIAVRNIKTRAIGSFYEWRNTPAGAGLVIRSVVAKHYVAQLLSSESRINLDRKGSSLMSAGDIDLAYTSIDMGFLNGLFPELEMTHIIPKNRVSKEYLVKLQMFNVLSNYLLEYFRFKKWPHTLPRKEYAKRQLLNFYHKNRFEYDMEKARRQGFYEAIRVLQSLSK